MPGDRRLPATSGRSKGAFVATRMLALVSGDHSLNHSRHWYGIFFGVRGSILWASSIFIKFGNFRASKYA
jgi:hypothetical protein